MVHFAIDPRAVGGDPEHAVPELLWTRFDELANRTDLDRLIHVIAGAGDLDESRAVGWAVTRCVDYWLWGVKHRLTEDPKRCEAIVTHLTGRPN